MTFVQINGSQLYEIMKNVTFEDKSSTDISDRVYFDKNGDPPPRLNCFFNIYFVIQLPFSVCKLAWETFFVTRNWLDG